jgi:hypothetical protein
MRKQVQDLKVGDILASTGAKVIIAPSAGLRTPAGKVELGLEYPNGQQVMRTWQKNMPILIASN